MAVKKGTYKIDNGSGYDEIMFKTTAEQVFFTDGQTFEDKLGNGTLKGPTGAKGATGAQGAIGPTGPKGANRSNGAQGPIGPTGPQGAKGSTGNIGPTGPTGPQGAAGAKGAAGAQGPAGPNVVSAITTTSGFTNGHFIYNNNGKIGAKAITPSDIGAATSGHTHSSYLPLSGGTITGTTTFTEETFKISAKNGYGTGNMGLWSNITHGELVVTGADRIRMADTGALVYDSSNPQTSVSGNAGTATKLQNARTINGTSFNGSASITTTKWGTARTLTLTGGATGSVSIDGSANISLATTVSWANVSGKPSSLPANGGNSDTVDNLHANAFARAHSGGYNFGGNQNAITTAQFIELIKAQGAFNQPVWISRGSWSYANNQYINDTGCGNIHLAGCTIEVIGTSSTYTIRIHTPTTSSSGVTNGEFIYVNNGTDYSPGWRRLYSTKYKPSTSDIGAAASSHSHSNYLNRGNWDTNGGQDLLVHGKRALVGMSNGALHLGYGGDFTDIRCGNNWMIWHNNNFDPDSKLGTVYKNNYWGMTQSNGNDREWLRVTSNGILPHSSNGAEGHGGSSIGTAAWTFNYGYIKTMTSTYGYVDRLRGKSMIERVRFGNGNARIDATNDHYVRMYTGVSSDVEATGSYWSPYGGMAIRVKDVAKHDLKADGGKIGGSIEIEGITYGMSPTDSPRSLIEDIIFDMNLTGEETVINLNDIFAKSLDKYAVFPSNKNVEVITKNKNSFIVRGTGLCDFRIVGTRIDYKDQYYEIMGGIIHGTEENATI